MFILGHFIISIFAFASPSRKISKKYNGKVLGVNLCGKFVRAGRIDHVTEQIGLKIFPASENFLMRCKQLISLYTIMLHLTCKIS